MVTQKYKDMLQKKSVIRTLSEFATKRGQEIGYENVFDYSLGNPSVPVVQDYTTILFACFRQRHRASFTATARVSDCLHLKKRWLHRLTSVLI